MLINSLLFPTGGQCTLSFEQPDNWLRATWTGFINTEEAMSGATNYLQQVEPFHCPFLLNDNEALRGPWFDSIEWLEKAWLPQAQRLGLQYVAHIVQADTSTDILTLKCPQHVAGTLEMQLFHAVPEAEEWLRGCQQRWAAAGGA